jgi:hypothetical protein
MRLFQNGSKLSRGHIGNLGRVDVGRMSVPIAVRRC